MKVAISGAQCTGKTTLMRQIIDSGLFEDYKIIPEVVRSIKKRVEKDHFEFNKSGDFKSQEMILAEHHRNVLRYENLITDRGALDAFVYATQNYLDGRFTFKEWKTFEMIFTQTVGSYDVIIYLPVGLIPMESDGVREVDEEYQEKIHNTFMWIFKKYGIEYVLMNDPLEERFDVLKGFLCTQGGCGVEGCKEC